MGNELKDSINRFIDKINIENRHDELIKEERFIVRDEITGYLYAYKTPRGLHIETTASMGSVNFEKWDDAYISHSQHDYFYTMNDSDLFDQICSLLSRTVWQLEILAPYKRSKCEPPTHLKGRGCLYRH